mgnify:CR=1 FL=1|jgi:hypothetical protein
MRSFDEMVLRGCLNGETQGAHAARPDPRGINAPNGPRLRRAQSVSAAMRSSQSATRTRKSSGRAGAMRWPPQSSTAKLARG